MSARPPGMNVLTPAQALCYPRCSTAVRVFPPARTSRRNPRGTIRLAPFPRHFAPKAPFSLEQLCAPLWARMLFESCNTGVRTIGPS